MDVAKNMPEQLKIEKEFTLISDSWITNFTERYNHFEMESFAENLCSSAFNYYNAIFNVFVFRIHDDLSQMFHIDLTSLPLQYFNVQLNDDQYGVYIFKEGYLKVHQKLKPWRAFGSYSNELNDGWNVLNFFYNN